MALADTSRAIGAVSAALKARIDTISGINVSVGRPSETVSGQPHLNLFLYEISFDPYLKNTPLNEGEKPPLWMVLKYLLTAFEAPEESDSEKAHEHMGAALRAVITDDLLKLDGLTGPIIDALDPNPSPLHVSFDESPSDLVAKLMQGPDDKVRLSACFQVRPVMIASAAPGDYSLLVGIDYTKMPVAPDTFVSTPKPVGVDVIPSMGSFISEIEPTGFEVGETVAIRGTDLHLANLSVMLGPVELPVTMQQPDELRFHVDPAIIAASGISAGSHPVTVVMTLPATGKKRKSNTVIGNLVPTLNTVAVSAPFNDPPVGPPTPVSRRQIDITGAALGNEGDDIILAFYKDGDVRVMLDGFVEGSGSLPDQTKRELKYDPTNAVPLGDYILILLVNGQRAPQSPAVTVA